MIYFSVRDDYDALLQPLFSSADSFELEHPRSSPDFKDVPKVRKAFPETWLWNNILLDSQGLVLIRLAYIRSKLLY